MRCDLCVKRPLPRKTAVAAVMLAAFLCGACRVSLERPPVGYSQGSDAYGYVVHVDDGDSFALRDGRRVRMIGVDCFETHENDKLFRDARRTGRDVFWMMRWGRKAGHFTRRMILHRWVRLDFDQERHDRYGRILAYVFIPIDSKTKRDEEMVVITSQDQRQEIFLNATLIKKGLARTLFIEPNLKYKDLFERLREKARKMKKGFWKEWDEAIIGFWQNGITGMDHLIGLIKHNFTQHMFGMIPCN